MTTQKQFATAIATGAILVNALAPVAFAESITVSGNGAYSQNGASVANTQTTTVNQNNNSVINNNVSSNASTGGNKSNFNTGGDTVIKTGDAKTDVNVSNSTNLNKASVETCNTCGGSADVKVEGNGSFSENYADVKSNNNTIVSQNNNAKINNNVDANAKTGNNKAGYNTGGDVAIVTGDAKTSVNVENKANANIAKVGGSNAGLGDGASVKILGNGVYSINGVDLENNSVVVLDQKNNADIDNDVDADAKTGDNSSDFNTGGDVYVETGNAKAKANVENFVNFNSADVDCGCTLDDLDVKIGSNGVDSFNTVEAANNDVLANIQVNDANLDNNVDADGKTGHNKSGYNVGGHGSDAAIVTGDSESKTDVSNNGNVNAFNQGGFDVPDDFDFHFDLSGLWSFFHLVG